MRGTKFVVVDKDAAIAVASALMSYARIFSVDYSVEGTEVGAIHPATVFTSPEPKGDIVEAIEEARNDFRPGYLLEQISWRDR